MKNQRKNMYQVKTPIGGFDNYKEVSIEQFDIYLSTINLGEDETISIINSKYLTNIDIDFSQEFLDLLEVNDSTSFDIFFTTVIQNPIRDSRVNMGAPLIVNNDKKLIGQYVIDDNEAFDMPKLVDLNVLSVR